MIPPGWYPDPWYPNSLRWWDGAAWTAQAHAAAAIPSRDPAKERQWANRAVIGFWIVGVCNAIASVGTAFVASGVNETGETTLDGGDAASTLGGLLVVQLFALGALGGMIVVALWSNHATHSARALGLPTRRTPGWATASWFVPIVSLWFPYQVVRDLFPRGHPARGRLGWWWALHLVSSGFGLRLSLSTGADMVGGSIAILVAGCGLAAAALGAELARAAAEEHERGLTHVAGVLAGRRL